MNTRILLLALVIALLPSLAAAKEVSAKISSLEGELKVHFTLAPGIHLYQDTIQAKLLKPEGVKLGKALFPEGKSKTDEYSGEARIVYSSSVTIPFPITENTVPSESSGKLELTWQACTDEACLMPETENFTVQILPLATTTAKREQSTAPERKSTAEGLMDRLGLLGYYLAGLLLSLTPCIFPMIPITISVIGSKEGGSLNGFLRSLVYVFGLALTYAVLGLAAAMSGGVIGAAMQNPFILGAVSLLFFAMGLSMMDLFYLQLPDFIQSKLSSVSGGKGYSGVFITGLVAGLVASPCVTPVLVGVLLQIAAAGDMVMGFLKLFVFAWGLGTILIVVGTFSSALSALPRAGTWMVEVKKVLGVLLMFASFYYLQAALPLHWFTVLFSVFLIILAVSAGATDSLPPETGNLPRFKKAFGLISLVVGIYLLGGTLLINGLFLPPILQCGINKGSHSSAVQPESQWIAASEALIADAKQRNKPVILDFGAEWCAACRKLEAETLSDGKVVNALNRFTTLKVDMTRPTTPTEKLRRKYSVVGFPSLIFIDSQGNVQKELTQIGFIDATALLKVLSQIE